MIEYIKNKIPETTAWMFCRECDKFDNGERPDRPCSGTPYDYETDNPPCKFYNFDNTILEKNNG